MDAHPSYTANISILVSQYHLGLRNSRKQNKAFISQLNYKQQLIYKHMKFELGIELIL